MIFNKVRIEPNEQLKNPIDNNFYYAMTGNKHYLSDKLKIKSLLYYG